MMPIRFFKTGWWFLALLLLPLNASLVFADPNVIAWESGNGYEQGQYGETNVPPDLTNAVAIAAGGFHTLALRSDGTVVAWGRNNEGETNVPTGLSNVVAVAAGYFHSLALKADGTLVAWGANFYGQTNVPAGLSNVVAMAGSYSATMALKADGTVQVWGGLFGLGAETNVPAGLSNVVAISAGYYDDMALRRDGTVVAWGAGPTSVTNVPADLTNAVAIDCSMSFSVEHSLALRSDGTVTSWGYTQAGVPVDLTNVCSIAAGGVAYGSPAVSRDLALKADGSLAGWGSTTNLPANVSNIVAIASGEAHQVALLGAGLPMRNAPATNWHYDGTHFSLQIPTQSGRVYSLEFKNALTDSQWTGLPLVASSNGPAVLADFSNTSGQRFYRVRRW